MLKPKTKRYEILIDIKWNWVGYPLIHLSIHFSVTKTVHRLSALYSELVARVDTW